MKVSMNAEVEVTIRESAWLTDLPNAHALVNDAALAAFGVASHDGVSEVAEISVVLADDRFVQALNRDFRATDKPTNVLAFATESNVIAQQPWLMGDVVIARELVKTEARAAEISLADHVSHLVVHGVLHLAGYDHQDDTAAVEMEALERRALVQVGVADPYARRIASTAPNSNSEMQAE